MRTAPIIIPSLFKKKLMKDKDISKNPDYFYCKKGKCTLRYDICLDRQLLYRENKHGYMEYIMCFKCEQGTQNR
jgi:hypothetical protein